MAAKTYTVYNSAMATTAAPVAQPTGNAIRTMLQLAPVSYPIRVIEWGCSFDGTTANTPGKAELVDTGTVFATMSTAFATADVQTWGDPNAPANTSGTSGIPLGLGTALSGFATAAVTEGSTTTTRMGDIQLLPPTAPYVKQFPLGREFEVKAGNALRVRMTFGTTVNSIIYVIFEV